MNESNNPMDLADLLNSSEFAEVAEEYSTWRRLEAMRAVVELRRRHSNFMRRPVVEVSVPVCDDCRTREQVALGQAYEPPDVLEDWAMDLEWFGVSKDEIASIQRAQVNREDFLRCHEVGCGRSLAYGSDFLYVKSWPFEEYFGELIPTPDELRKRKARRWMKELIYEAYGGKCFGCGRILTHETWRADHIMPFSEGGLSEPMNLQLLCEECDARVKANKVPEDECFQLHFPLVPVSDSFEGVVW